MSHSRQLNVEIRSCRINWNRPSVRVTYNFIYFRRKVTCLSFWLACLRLSHDPELSIRVLTNEQLTKHFQSCDVTNKIMGQIVALMNVEEVPFFLLECIHGQYMKCALKYDMEWIMQPTVEEGIEMSKNGVEFGIASCSSTNFH